MPARLQETAAIVPAAVHVRLKRETNLSAMTQELAGLRFSIILLARWEAARSVDETTLADLREELAQLRLQYFKTIDELAMAFGVQQAMETRQSVERSVIVPKNLAPPLKWLEPAQLYF
jgi:hypothetical protein